MAVDLYIILRISIYIVEANRPAKQFISIKIRQMIVGDTLDHSEIDFFLHDPQHRCENLDTIPANPTIADRTFLHLHACSCGSYCQ